MEAAHLDRPHSQGHYKEVAEDVLRLYTSLRDADLRREVLARCYAPNARFADPIVNVCGHKAIEAQFASLSWFFRRIVMRKAPMEFDPRTHSIVIDSVQEYLYRLVPFAKLHLHNKIELKLDEAGLVLEHIDHWGWRDLVKGSPIIRHFFGI